VIINPIERTRVTMRRIRIIGCDPSATGVGQ